MSKTSVGFRRQLVLYEVTAAEDSGADIMLPLKVTTRQQSNTDMRELAFAR